MIKLKNKNEINEINVLQMCDGDVAIITSWSVDDYVGIVVQRYDESLISLGRPSRSGWSGVFTKKSNTDLSTHKFKVRLLKRGEELVIS